MVVAWHRFCPTLVEFVDVDKPCPLEPPSECLYEGTARCPLIREKEERKREQPI